MSRRCDQCGDEIPVGAGVRSHDSTGFGHANTRWSSFCDPACRARYRGDDVVLGSTLQATLVRFVDGVRPSDPAATAWSIE